MEKQQEKQEAESTTIQLMDKNELRKYGMPSYSVANLVTTMPGTERRKATELNRKAKGLIESGKKDEAESVKKQYDELKAKYTFIIVLNFARVPLTKVADCAGRPQSLIVEMQNNWLRGHKQIADIVAKNTGAIEYTDDGKTFNYAGGKLYIDVISWLARPKIKAMPDEQKLANNMAKLDVDKQDEVLVKTIMTRRNVDEKTAREIVASLFA